MKKGDHKGRLYPGRMGIHNLKMLAGSPAGIYGKNLEFATDNVVTVQRLLKFLPAQRKFPTVDTCSD